MKFRGTWIELGEKNHSDEYLLIKQINENKTKQKEMKNIHSY